MAKGYATAPWGTYRMYQFSKEFTFRNELYRISARYSFGLLTHREFKKTKIDLRSLEPGKYTTSFGKNWQAYIVDFFGLGLMIQKEIK